MKWFRPRFSVRVLLIALTLLCAYLACWVPTKERGFVDVQRRLNPTLGYNATTIAPLVVGMDVQETKSPFPTKLGYVSRRYYFWFFGYVTRLPHERKRKMSLEDVLVRLLRDTEGSAAYTEVFETRRNPPF